jgi:hypothetical protein
MVRGSATKPSAACDQSALISIGLFLMAGCGSSSSNSGGGGSGGGASAGTYTINVTGSAGPTVSSMTVSLVVQ